MELDEVWRKAVKAFYEGASFEEYEKAKGAPLKYNLDYFDDIEEEIRRKASKGKNKKKEKEVLEELDLDEKEPDNDKDDKEEESDEGSFVEGYDDLEETE